MAKLKIDGVPGLDGEYELIRSSEFTMAEWHLVREVSGVRGGELEDALEAEDMGAYVAVAMVAMMRAGKTRRLCELLWGAKPAAFEFVAGEKKPEEAEERPPASPTASGSESSPSEPTSNGSSESSSGASSSGDSVPLPETTLRAIGGPG